jgi:hypothetical protein
MGLFRFDLKKRLSFVIAGYSTLMKWPRYRRVISLEIQVEITSQINKWVNTEPRMYRRWDQVPRRSKHPHKHRPPEILEVGSGA